MSSASHPALAARRVLVAHGDVDHEARPLGQHARSGLATISAAPLRGHVSRGRSSPPATRPCVEELERTAAASSVKRRSKPNAVHLLRVPGEIERGEERARPRSPSARPGPPSWKSRAQRHQHAPRGPLAARPPLERPELVLRAARAPASRSASASPGARRASPRARAGRIGTTFSEALMPAPRLRAPRRLGDADSRGRP